MTSLEGLNDRFQALRADLRNADLKGTFAFVAAVRRFVSEQATLERSEKEVRAMVDGREERFLELVRTRVYSCPSSPYPKLLRRVGCAYADLEAQVLRYGLDDP